MLLNDLYTIQSLTESGNRIQCTVLIKEDHDIFKGHFPSHPVLPGVCMMEMVTEILGENSGQSYRISAAPLIKFLLMIDPRKNPVIEIEINYQAGNSTISTNGKIFSGTQIFMKFNLTLITE